MKGPIDDQDRILDQALEQIRNERLDADTERKAVDRVWHSIADAAPPDTSSESRHLENCGDFQALLPDMLDGGLSEGRRLLVEDHLGECVTCRRALKEIRSFRNKAQRAKAARAGRRSSWVSTMSWRVASVAAIFVALIGVSFNSKIFSFETGGTIRVRSVQGQLLRITEDGSVPMAADEEVTLQPGEMVRTAKGSNAIIELADKSRVEMRERSELAVTERRSWIPAMRPDGVIGLERGAIIVEASDQGSGHLYVDTDDCRVAVTGTTFAVNHGMKGSRVSVIEGEVHVNHGSLKDVLTPGDQTTTNATLTRIPVEDEIAWSQNVAQHVALLREVQALGREMDQALNPGLRYSTNLLDVTPGDTVFYVSLPNVSGGLGEAYDIFQQRIASNEMLRNWWERSDASSGEIDLDRIVDKVRSFGDHLGEEVVITLQMDDRGNVAAPVIMAQLGDPDALRGLLVEQINELVATESLHGDEIVLIDGELPPNPAGNGGEVYFWIREDLLAISPEMPGLYNLSSSIAQGRTAEDGFRQRISSMYDDGVEWLIGVDLERMLESGTDTEQARNTLEGLGLDDVQYLIAERKQRGEMAENRAELSFNGPRQAFASWLAEPAPMGSLDYISTNANFATAFVMLDMEEQVDNLFDLIAMTDSSFRQDLAEFEREHGIDIRRDIAAPLGGEFAVAIDGPLLPIPSWKVVLEVYDPSRLEQTLGWMVEQLNLVAAEAGKAGFSLERTEIGGRPYFEMRSLDASISAHFVFDEGYLVAGPSRTIIDRALQTRAMGVGLADSSEFASLYPEDDEVNFSGMIYQNLGQVLGPLSRMIGGAVGEISPDQQQMMEAMASEARPSLVVFRGERDRISMVGTVEGGLISSGLGTLLGADRLLGVQESMLRAVDN